MLKKELQIILLVFLVHTGVYGQSYALDFDGSNDYVDIGGIVNNPNILTQEAWVKTTMTTQGIILTKRHVNDSDWPSILIVNGKAVISVDDIGYRTDIASTTSVNDGAWHHIAGVKNGSSYLIYVDGVLENSATDTHSMGGSTYNFHIGHHGGWNQYFNGQIDEVRVWDDARTASEISGNMNTELTGSESNLIAYYNMNAGSGTSLTDNSSTSNTGTLTNMDATTDWVTGKTFSVTVITKYGEISTTRAYSVSKYGEIGAESLSANGERANITLGADGLTSANASTSASQIKQDFPSSVDGVYWITNSNINGGTPFQIYADMTTDGGGWILLNVGAGNSAAPEASSLTSPDVLGYLPRTTVIALANLSTDVQLRAGNSSSSYAHKTTSTNPLAIGALQSTSNVVNGASTWANGASSTFVVNSGTWQWAYCCPGNAAGWPKMYHSNNYTNGVHWFADSGMGRKHADPRDTWFSTWIR